MMHIYALKITQLDFEQAKQPNCIKIRKSEL
jgi:hypothetical protein